MPDEVHWGQLKAQVTPQRWHASLAVLRTVEGLYQYPSGVGRPTSRCTPPCKESRDSISARFSVTRWLRWCALQICFKRDIAILTSITSSSVLVSCWITVNWVGLFIRPIFMAFCFFLWLTLMWINLLIWPILTTLCLSIWPSLVALCLFDFHAFLFYITNSYFTLPIIWPTLTLFCSSDQFYCILPVNLTDSCFLHICPFPSCLPSVFAQTISTAQLVVFREL